MGEREKGWNGSVRKMRCDEGMGQREEGWTGSVMIREVGQGNTLKGRMQKRVSEEREEGIAEWVKGGQGWEEEGQYTGKVCCLKWCFGGESF